MRKIYALLTILMFAFTLNAQYIYNDFDANQNETFLGDPNTPAVVANPDASGINTSANVAEWVRGEGYQWAHVYTDLDGKIDFSTGTTFQLKVYSPIACEVLFKLEDKLNGGTFVEVMGNVTTPNEWQLLTYDFSGAASGTYDKVVIFFDFATTTDNTFYFDDVEGPEYVTGGPNDPLYLPVTFDDENVNYALTDFGGNLSEIIVDPDNAENNIAQSTKTVEAETWAGTTVGGVVGFAVPIPFEEGSTSMSVAVYSPTVDTPIRLKVEDAGDPTKSVETEAMTTVANAWEVLVFDFSNEATGTAEINFGYNYNKASIFFNFGTTGADAGEQTYYWDDMEFVGGGTGEKPLESKDVQDNFEDDGWGNITTWAFQDPDMVELPIVADPIDATNHVAEYNRSGNFEWTNAQFVLDHRMDLTVRNVFDIEVYFPSSNDYAGDMGAIAALKLQNSLLGGEAWTTQTEVILDVTEFDTWTSLSFDFSAVADRTDYDQVVVQLGGEGHFVPGVFYFDDIMLTDPSGILEQNIAQAHVYPNPATDIINIKNSTDFEGISIFSMTGKLVYQTNEVSSSVNVSDFPTGMYNLQAISTDGKIYQAKFIVR